MIKPQHADGYDLRTTEAVKRTLIDVAHILGSYLDHLVIVGGLVPTLIVTAEDAPHVGTSDIDLGLDAKKLSKDNAYVEVIRLLEQGQFHRNDEPEHADLKEFQMATLVDLHDQAPPVKVELDLLIQKGVRLKRHRPVLVENLRTLQIRGIDLALQHTQLVTIKGRTRNGSLDQATLRVVRPEAFLMMKGLALKGRREPKDSYDIYFMIRNAEQGPAALGRSCRALQSHPDAEDGYKAICEKFEMQDSYGPSDVLNFLRGQDERDDDEIRVDAFRQVQAWINGLMTDQDGMSH